MKDLNISMPKDFKTKVPHQTLKSLSPWSSTEENRNSTLKVFKTRLKDLNHKKKLKDLHQVLKKTEIEDLKYFKTKLKDLNH